MAAPVVLARITAWERSGAIDHALAEQLRALEAAEPAAVETSPAFVEASPAPEGASSGRVVPSGFILEFFAYLGGLFVLLAWYAWFLVELPASERERNLALALAALVPGLVLGIAGWVLAPPGNAHLRRAAAIALAAAVPNAGFAAWYLLLAAGVDVDGSFLAFVAGTVVAVTVAVVARARRPSAITQAALLAAWGAFGLGVSLWAREVLWPGDRGLAGGAAEEPTLLYAAHVLWWWAVAAVPGVILLARPDRAAGHEARATATRVGIGTIAVFGTWVAALEGGEGGFAFEPWLSAALMLLVGVAFVAIARWTGARAHVVTAGVAIIIGLTYLNAEYVAGPAGVAAAFLVEGVILLGVAGLGWAAGRVVTRRGAAQGA